MRTEDRMTAAARSRSGLRASDNDRDRVLEMLKTAFVQGRLTKHEFDARVGQTLLARTFADLTALTADIPAWQIPRPVGKPAKTPSPPAHAVVKAVACAIIALVAIATAGLPAMNTAPAPRNMSIAACYAFYDWIGATVDQARGSAGLPVMPTLDRAVTLAQLGPNRALARHLANLEQAYQREDLVAPAQRHFAANHVRRDTSQVVSDCQSDGP